MLEELSFAGARRTETKARSNTGLPARRSSPKLLTVATSRNLGADKSNVITTNSYIDVSLKIQMQSNRICCEV